VHSNSPKNNFDSIHTKKIDSNRFKFESIQIDSIRQVYTLLLSDEKWGRSGGESANWCLDTHFSCLCACCCSIDSTVTVKYCIQTPGCGRIERSVFWETELIRIDSSSESNRTVCALCDGLVCQRIKNVLIFLVICWHYNVKMSPLLTQNC